MEAWEADRKLTILQLLLGLAYSISRYTQVFMDASLLMQCITALHKPSTINIQWFYFLVLGKFGMIFLQFGLTKAKLSIEKKFVASFGKMRHMKLLIAFCGLEYSEQIRQDVQRIFLRVLQRSNQAVGFFTDIVEGSFRIAEMCVSLMSLSLSLTKFSPRLTMLASSLVIANVVNWVYFLYFADEDDETYFLFYRTPNHRKASALENFLFSGEEATRDLNLHNAFPWLLKTYEENADTFSFAGGRFQASKSELVISVLQVFQLIGIPMLAIANGDSVHLHAYNLARKQISAIGTHLSTLERTMSTTLDHIVPFAEKYFGCLSRLKRNRKLGKRISAPVILIALRNVSYSYDLNESLKEKETLEGLCHGPNNINATKMAIQNFSFEFESGKVYSIIGKNGSGKTTLVALLTKLLSPVSGDITVNGVDLTSLSEESWLEKLAVVPQKFSKLSELTIRENIGLGSTSLLDEDSDNIIEDEADKLGIKEYATLDTYLGDSTLSCKINTKEKWQQNLSGGQQQCIALARAFIRRSAEVVIFDEPSSALDPEAEHTLFERLWKERHRRITLFVSHRLQTCRASDCIIVMDQGSILEVGTHSELMANKNGHYAKLNELQAKIWE